MHNSITNSRKYIIDYFQEVPVSPCSSSRIFLAKAKISISVDPKRELFLSDILDCFRVNGVGCNYSFYVVIQDRLVWLDSPSCLVPVCYDGIVRMVLRPTSIPPLIYYKQCIDFADKSRIQFYSRADYERSGPHVYSLFHQTAQEINHHKLKRKQQSQTNSNNFEPTYPPSRPERYVDSATNPIYVDDFADFDATFSGSGASKVTQSSRQQQPQRSHYAEREAEVPQRPPSYPKYSDRPFHSDSSSADHRDYDDRVNPPRRYSLPSKKLDHPSKHPGQHGGGGAQASAGSGDHNLHSIVGDDTAAVLNEAVEAAGVAAKSFLSFASNFGKSVFDLAKAGAEGGLPGGLNAGPPGRLYPGSVVQVGRMAVSVVRELAEGGFGMVYLVEDCAASRGSSQHAPPQFALKQLLCQSREQVTEAHHELDILRQMSGRGGGRIIELVEYTAAGGGGTGPITAAQPKQVLMLFPIFPLGTLWDKIAEGSQPHVHLWPFPEHVALYIIMCAAEALQVLHTEGLAHRDVKPHNFLIEAIPEHIRRAQNLPSQFTPVLMDLGSVTTARIPIRNKRDALQLEEEAACKTSAAYRSPELTSPPFPPFQIDERVDTWGLGCTMYCLAFGRSPFETAKEGVLRLGILNGKYTIPQGNRHKDCVYSSEYLHLIERMLHVDITERPYVEEIIRECQNLLAKF